MTRQIPVQLSGRALAVVAVALALLAVSAQPVAASHGQLAVASEHTTESELAGGTVSDLSITGAGTSLVLPDAQADRFEDGTLDGWTQLSGTWSESNGYFSSDSGDQDIQWTSAGEVGPGFTATVELQPDFDTPDSSANPGVTFLSQDENNFYMVRFNDGSEISLRKVVNGNYYTRDLVTGSFNKTHWHSIEIEYSSGETTVTVTDQTTEEEWTLSNTFDPQADFGTATGYLGALSYSGAASDSRWDNFEVHSSDSGWYRSTNHSVSNARKGWVNLSLSNASATVDWRGYDGSQWQVVNSATYSASGNKTLDISEMSFDTWRVNVSFEKTGDNSTAQLYSEGILVETDEPTVDNASATPDTTSESKGAPLDLTIPVDDPDFDTSHGDTVTVDYYVDGSKVATETTSSAGDVSTTISSLDAGDHTWHVEVSDQHGHSTTSDTFEFTTASELRVLDERNPDQLVQEDVSVTVRLYADDSTVEREVSDGTLDLSGLPLNSTIVATTEADGWIDRRVLIRDLTQQQEIYLLSSSAESVSITFSMDDKTGDFPDDTSQLYVEKALNTSSTEELEWKTITGDYFGADGSFQTDLAYSQRYRLVIRNNQGDVRVLGSYIPTEPGVYTVTIGEIVWDVPEGEQVVFRSNRKELGENADETYPDASEGLELKYNDSEGVTEELHISVTTRATNETIYETTVYGVSSYKNTVPLTAEEANKSLVVNASAARSGDHEDFEQSGQMGNIEEQNLPMDPQWVSLLTQLTIGVIICLVAGKMPRAGGLVVLPVAFAVTWLGFWSIHPASLGFAGMIALYRAADTEGGGY